MFLKDETQAKNRQGASMLINSETFRKLPTKE